MQKGQGKSLYFSIKSAVLTMVSLLKTREFLSMAKEVFLYERIVML